MASVADGGPGVEPAGMGALDHDDLAFLSLVRVGHYGDEAAGPGLGLADWLEVQAAAIEAKGRGARPSAWLARQVAELAAMARRLSAATPEDFDARFQLEDEARLTTAWDEGYEACDRRTKTESQLAMTWGTDR